MRKQKKQKEESCALFCVCSHSCVFWCYFGSYACVERSLTVSMTVFFEHSYACVDCSLTVHDLFSEHSYACVDCSLTAHEVLCSLTFLCLCWLFTNCPRLCSLNISMPVLTVHWLPMTMFSEHSYTCLCWLFLWLFTWLFLWLFTDQLHDCSCERVHWLVWPCSLLYPLCFFQSGQPNGALSAVPSHQRNCGDPRFRLCGGSSYRRRCDETFGGHSTPRVVR